jgi:plasmid stabilization system protein ParE
MKLSFSRLAQSEFEDAKAYYNLQQESLGERFKDHIRESTDMIKRFPLLYPKVTDTLHRVVLHKFPYSLYYTIDKDTVIIVSIAHQHRKPFYRVENISAD